MGEAPGGVRNVGCVSYFRNGKCNAKDDEVEVGEESMGVGGDIGKVKGLNAFNTRFHFKFLNFPTNYFTLHLLHLLHHSISSSSSSSSSKKEIEREPGD
jgi:hypothetical protein